MSIGIACRQPGGGEELDDVIQRADRAMYDVKRNGRGHWRVSHPERARVKPQRRSGRRRTAEARARSARGECRRDRVELSLLAADPDVLVRAAVAINRGCAPDVDRILAEDGDERVRALLAGRIARLLPELRRDDQATLPSMSGPCCSSWLRTRRYGSVRRSPRR